MTPIVEESRPTVTGVQAREVGKNEEALRLHRLYQGKIQLAPKCPIRGARDFSWLYTPGVAAPCRAIQANPAEVWEYTNKANLIAVVSDGSRVLGLGNIGPLAGLPVMEGKALLFSISAASMPSLFVSGRRMNASLCGQFSFSSLHSAQSIWRISLNPAAFECSMNCEGP